MLFNKINLSNCYNILTSYVIHLFSKVIVSRLANTAPVMRAFMLSLSQSIFTQVIKNNNTNTNILLRFLDVSIIASPIQLVFYYITQTSHMKNMSFSHNHTALSNKHYQAADFCSALRIYSGSLLTKSCAITCSCLSVAWNTVLILASITSCKIIMDCWNVTSAISFTIR